MSFNFFFEQYETEDQYFDTIQGKLSSSGKYGLDPADLQSELSLENLESYPKRLKVITREDDETLDLRLFHDYISAVQLIYSIFQSNENYEVYELLFANQYYNRSFYNPDLPVEKVFGTDADLQEFLSELNKDYKLITELASKRNFLKITSAVKIESISKNSPLEIVFASSFFLLTLGIILSGGKLKYDAKTKTLEIELPNLASGLRPLIAIFKKDKSEDKSLPAPNTGNLFDETNDDEDLDESDNFKTD